MMAFEILNTTWPELAQRTPWGRGICFIDFTIHSPAWSDVYIDGGSASGWEIRVKIQQVLSAWTEKCGEWFSVRNESSEPGGHQQGQGATSCFSSQGQEEDRCLADKPINLLQKLS